MNISLVPIQERVTLWRQTYPSLLGCKVKGNGDCLFHSVQIAATIHDDIKTMRKKCYQALLQAQQQQILHIPPKIDLSSIIQSKSWNNIPGDFMIYGLALAYQLQIRVFTFTGDGTQGNILLITPSSYTQSISLQLDSESSHYDALIPPENSQAIQSCNQAFKPYHETKETHLLARCNETKEQLIQILRHRGIDEFSLQTFTEPQLCALYAAFQADPHENFTISPAEMRSLWRDISFSINLKYIVQESSKVKPFTDFLSEQNTIFYDIQANTSFDIVAIQNHTNIQQTIQKFIKYLLAQSTDWTYKNTYKSEAAGIPAILTSLNDSLTFEPLSKGAYSRTYITRANFANQLPVAILKVALRANREINKGVILHEMAIGYALNQLQLGNIWFTYLYGGFFCDMSTDSGKICIGKYTPSFNTTVAMSFQEYIPVSIEQSGRVTVATLLDFPKQYSATVTSDQIVNVFNQVFVQVATALYFAQSQYKFMHFDLHSKNVLMRKSPPEIESLPYPIEITDENNNLLFEHTFYYVRYIPCIIDYGMSVATVQDEEGQDVILINRWPCEHKPIQAASMISLGNGSYDEKYFLPIWDFFVYLASVLFEPLMEKNISRFPQAMRDACVIMINQWFPYLKKRLFEYGGAKRNDQIQPTYHSILTKFINQREYTYEACMEMGEIFGGPQYNEKKEFVKYTFPITQNMSAAEGYYGFFRNVNEKELIYWLQSWKFYSQQYHS